MLEEGRKVLRNETYGNEATQRSNRPTVPYRTVDTQNADATMSGGSLRGRASGGSKAMRKGAPHALT